MKATGIVRRIDDLGRVVIPKEIRRTLRIKEGDPLEIFTDREGEIILKKYSPIGELTEFSDSYVESLYETTRFTAIITDRDTVIAVAGPNKRDYFEQKVSPDLEKIVETRELFVFEGGSNASRIGAAEYEPKDYTAQVIAPIIVQGDAIGAVVLVSKEKNAKMGEAEQKLLKNASLFLSRQMEG